MQLREALRCHAPVLCALSAWAYERLARLTDWLVDAAMARLGESMEWEDVERLAQDKIKEEYCMAAKRWKALQERGRPMLRLLSKP